MPGAGAVASDQESPVAAGSFTSAGSLAEARFGHTATLLPDGRVLIVGGSGEVNASVEVWGPTTMSFGPAGSMAEARIFFHTSTALPDGRALVVGGVDSGGAPIASAEIWAPTRR